LVTDNEGRSLVVIDDHPGVARGLAALLTRIGCRVAVADNGLEGLALCRDLVPDVIVLDLALPDIDGFAILAELKEAPGLEDTRFIAMSGNDEEPVRARARRAGFHHFVKKPGSLETFRALLGL
jgi:CheY-like chemotaxis protein